ncbi:GNAT family N-acetyltransferase [Akkermansiaceae bacterium]|nr:GNAT family N-acetyltransferase [Akkermansiaceae bacterium]
MLQYVPFFRGKTFVLVVNAARMPELALAESLLDLIALQQVGVKLVVISTGSGEARIDHLLIDGELKWQSADLKKSEVEAILNRGQLALIEKPGLESLGDDLVEFAGSLGAFKLIVLLPEQVSGGNAISSEEALKWEGDGEDLLHRAAEVCNRGIPRVHLLNEAHQGVLMDELFSNEGVGVMVYADDYLSIRPIGPDDISELLAMVGRSMRDAHLVPRSYEEIETSLSDFLVMTIDGNVVGCVALHCSDDPKCAEIACLYVKQSHGGQGYGQLLVQAAEERARELGIPWVFALSTRAVDFFVEQLEYQPCPIEEIPRSRQERLRASGRESSVIRKTIPA